MTTQTDIQIDGYTFYWSAGVNDYLTKSEIYKLPLINPGKTHDFVVPNKFNDKGVITIIDGRGHVVYQKVIDKTAVYF